MNGPYWIYLTLAILSEVFGTTSMKYSEGFTKIIPSTLVVFFYVTSLIFFNYNRISYTLELEDCVQNGDFLALP